MKRFTKKKFEREAREKKNDLNSTNMALLAGLRYRVKVMIWRS